ncbi:MAG: biopolymer transporter ExbD [Cytophagales bacterium]|jgi:biopolymer transport protein ExbD
MAEVVTGKKGAPRVDMTPMVDLGFLLITFFMLTTTMTQQAGMDIQMPFDDKTGKTQGVKESNALTIILGKNNKIFYYRGLKEPQLKLTDFSPNGIRKVLLESKAEIGAKMNVLVKPMAKSKYKNMVDILDELAITTVPTYTLSKVSEEDKKLVFSFGYRTEETDE